MKNTKTITASVVAFIFGVSLSVLYSCNAIKQISPTTTDEPPGRFDKDVGNKLKFGNEPVEVVFALNKKGKLKPYVKQGKTLKKEKFPLPAGDISALKSITVFQTTNPKICWPNSTGQLECIVY